jgi:hypothetical protein
MQVYLLLSCCPCEGRISGIVDAPNAVATLAIPTAIFDQVSCNRSTESLLGTLNGVHHYCCVPFYPLLVRIERQGSDLCILYDLGSNLSFPCCICLEKPKSGMR